MNRLYRIFIVCCLVLIGLPATAQTPTLRTLISAQSALNSTGTVSDASKCGESTVYVQWSAGTGAGVVTVETASSSSYAGTWASLATVTWSAASKEDVVQITGITRAIRTRISTLVTGGTISTFFLCK